MTDHLGKLYNIDGLGNANIKRTEKAMEWLHSGPGREIGEKLLQAAFKRTGKPLDIIVSEVANPQYISDEHIAYINPTMLDKVRIVKRDGTLGKLSLEQSLAHELVHAARDDNIEIIRKEMDLRVKLASDFENNLTPKKKARIQALRVLARGAETYEKAMEYVGRYVDEYAVPMQQYLNAELNKYPDHIKYIDKRERPAMEIENKVAMMSG